MVAERSVVIFQILPIYAIAPDIRRVASPLDRYILARGHTHPHFRHLGGGSAWRCGPPPQLAGILADLRLRKSSLRDAPGFPGFGPQESTPIPCVWMGMWGYHVNKMPGIARDRGSGEDRRRPTSAQCAHGSLLFLSISFRDFLASMLEIDARIA